MRVTRASAALRAGRPRSRVVRLAEGVVHLVRIRIYGIIGFSGFYQLVFKRQALIRIRLGGISNYGEKRELGEAKSCKSRQSRQS